MRIRAFVLSACITTTAGAQTIDSFYAVNYTFTDLGSVPGVPTNYGGVTFKFDDSNVMLIGGLANNVGAQIYAIEVERDCDNHITGFVGRAQPFATASNIDGGLTYGPQNVLFFTTYNNNMLGQIEPGSTTPDLMINLTALGVAASTGTLQFVPPGFPGAGRLKIASYNASRWYDAVVTPDGSGTYTVSGVTDMGVIGGGPEGIVFVAAGNPLFGEDSAIVCEYSAGRVVTYELNDNGDPIVDTRRVFMTGLSGAEGATIDPVTGDFIFSTFGGGNRVIAVKGFNNPDACDVDLNDNGLVNAADLAMLLGSWGECPNCPADYTGDCTINAADLAILLGAWGECKK